jgi:hypothetical protein
MAGTGRTWRGRKSVHLGVATPRSGGAGRGGREQTWTHAGATFPARRDGDRRLRGSASVGTKLPLAPDLGSGLHLDKLVTMKTEEC